MISIKIYNILNKIFVNNNMSGCIKYPILFSGGNIDNIYDYNLKKSKDKGFKNSKKNNQNLLFDSEFKYDCENFEEIPHILPAKKRIIAIGDLHGDHDLTINCLKLAKVIDYKLNWIAKPKDTVVVQIGDQVDRCRPLVGSKCNDPKTTLKDEGSDIKIINLFNELNKKAKKYNGAVISLLGNHEIMNVQGNMNYVSYEGLKQFEDEIDPETGIKFESGMAARKYLFKRGNKYANLMACTRQTAVIIGSNLFVHAAIVPKLAKLYDVRDINVMVRKWLLKQFSSNKNIEGIGKLKDILVNYEVSPFWPRLLGSLPPDMNIDDDKCIEYLDETLNLYKCNNIIIGHTPQFYSNKTGISSTCKGINKQNEKNMGVWRIDTGSSKAFESFDSEINSDIRQPSILEILDDNKFNIIT